MLTASTDAPSASALLSGWSPQPLPVVLILVVSAWYVTRLRALDNDAGRWPRRYTASFALGLVLWAWVSCGFPQVYGQSLFWVWTVQKLSFLLIVPLALMAGQPVELARRTGGADGLVVRLFRSRPVRVLGSPLVGPALLPVLSLALFFGPLSGWAVQWPFFGSVVSAVVLALGAMVALPMVAVNDTRSGLVAGAVVVVGILELLTDAVPGIVLRLQSTVVSSYFAHRDAHSWSLQPVVDQNRSGGILWGLAELLDLPFLILAFVRWTRADQREAREIDIVLEAERTARSSENRHPDDAPPADQPWWLTDGQMQDRLRLRDR